MGLIAAVIICLAAERQWETEKGRKNRECENDNQITHLYFSILFQKFVYHVKVSEAKSLSCVSLKLHGL